MADELLISDLAPMGDGIHRAGDGRIYVERTLPGDVVRAKVKRAPGGILRGEVMELLTPSPHRVKAPCRHYDDCGGCALQHAGEDFYRTWKVEVVRTALNKRGLQPDTWHAPVFVPAGTRRRVTFAAFGAKQGAVLGFHRRRTHQLTDVAGCLVAESAIMDLRARLAASLGPVLRGGKTADVFIQTVEGQYDVVLTGPLGRSGAPDLYVREAIAALAHALKIGRVSWRPREKMEPEVLVEVNPVIAKFGVLDVALPPLAFLQPTRIGEDALAAAVMAALPASGRYADLFSGCGTFSGRVLARGPVDAFENAEASVRALAKAKGAAPLNVARRDLFRNPLEPSEVSRYDAVVFDPPRAGAEAQAKALAGGKVPCIIGVSCNPVTFARDARILADGGYTLASVQVVDQFTWSHHVEVVGVFSKGA